MDLLRIKDNCVTLRAPDGDFFLGFQAFLCTCYKASQLKDALLKPSNLLSDDLFLQQKGKEEKRKADWFIVSFSSTFGLLLRARPWQYDCTYLYSQNVTVVKSLNSGARSHGACVPLPPNIHSSAPR